MAKKKQKSVLLALAAAAVVVVFAVAALVYFNAPKTPSLKIYFIKDGELSYVGRPIDKGQDLIAYAAFELLRGPSEKERSEGYVSEIPQNAQIISIKKQKEVLRVKFSQALQKYGGGSARVQGLVAQIVYTFTEIPGIEKVQILIVGKKTAVLGGEGLVIDKPLSREDAKF